MRSSKSDIYHVALWLVSCQNTYNLAYSYRMQKLTDGGSETSQYQ